MTYAGRFYQIPTSEIGPKPVRSAGVPVLIAGSSPDYFFGLVDQPAVGEATRRAARIADGLNPYQRTSDALAAEIDTFRDAARRAGRDAHALPVVARMDATLTDDRPIDDDQHPLFTGTIAQWAEDLTRTADLGVDHEFLDITAPIDDQIEAMRELLKLTTVV